MGRTTTAEFQAEIEKGVFRPHTALTNLALSYYQNASNYFAKAIFRYVRWGYRQIIIIFLIKEELLRDSWRREACVWKGRTCSDLRTHRYICVQGRPDDYGN